MNKFFLFLSLTLFTLSLSAQSAKNISLIGHLTYAEELNDVWAYVTDTGHEYALVGLYDGVSIVDITTDPTNPTQVQFIPGRNSIWRDLKVFQQYAYVTNETGDGLLIIDLSDLPSSVNFKDTILQSVETAHNVWIDENGIMYLVGVNNSNGTGNYNGGMVMFDLKPNPWQPLYLGAYTERYVHDVYVRNNLAYAGEVDDGLLTIINVANKANPVVLGSRSYANSFTHNTWLNGSGNVCFTTDELDAAYVYAWDVSDPTDIIELDRIRSSLSEGRAVPHNVHVFNDFLVTSYYKDGLNIVDATRPTNLVEVGYYDTSPMENGDTEGCWGAYPFLPSGLVLATDIQEGLFVFQSNYTRACYLEGNVTSAATNQSLNNVIIQSPKSELETGTNNMGAYATGTADAGTYQLTFIKYGYVSANRSVSLTNGMLSVEDVAMEVAPKVAYTFHVVDAISKQPIPNAYIQVNAPADAASIDYQADMNGTATDTALFAGQYDVAAGKWGYITHGVQVQVDSMNNSVTIELHKGYYDDFIFDYNWSVTGDAMSGIWERGEPNGTDLFGNVANPNVDMATDFGKQAFVTGNMPGEYFEDDVDDGSTVLTSPTMDLSTFADPVLRYHWWLLNFSTNGFKDGDDTLRVIVNNGGQNIEVAKYANAWRNRWNEQKAIHLNNFFSSFSNSVRVTFAVGDLNIQNILEAGIDVFLVTDGEAMVGIGEPFSAQNQMIIYPNPIQDRLNLIYELASPVEGELSFELFSLNGQRVMEKRFPATSEKLEIDFPFAKGIYLAVLRKEGQVLVSKKIVK